MKAQTLQEVQFELVRELVKKFGKKKTVEILDGKNPADMERILAKGNNYRIRQCLWKLDQMNRKK